MSTKTYMLHTKITEIWALKPKKEAHGYFQCRWNNRGKRRGGRDTIFGLISDLSMIIIFIDTILHITKIEQSCWHIHLKSLISWIPVHLPKFLYQKLYNSIPIFNFSLHFYPLVLGSITSVSVPLAIQSFIKFIRCILIFINSISSDSFIKRISLNFSAGDFQLFFFASNCYLKWRNVDRLKTEIVQVELLGTHWHLGNANSLSAVFDISIRAELERGLRRNFHNFFLTSLLHFFRRFAITHDIIIWKVDTEVSFFLA